MAIPLKSIFDYELCSCQRINGKACGLFCIQFDGLESVHSRVNAMGGCLMLDFQKSATAHSADCANLFGAQRSKVRLAGPPIGDLELF
ncbi:MAG TPA: hypothetical protein PLB25_09655 [Rhodoferax sp.]|nr:hypothetical protein [Rhodoferax sp.]